MEIRGRRSRAVRYLACLALSAVLAAACGSNMESASPPSKAQTPSCKASKGRVDLTFWSYAPQAAELVKIFNETHPRIHVTLKQISGDTQQQMFNALKAGTPPDVATIELSDLPGFRAAHGAENLAGCRSVAHLKTQVLPWTWKQATAGGAGVYAVPWSIGPMALFYRSDVFKRNHLSVPRTWNEYYEAAKRLRQLDKSTYMTNFSAGHAQLLMSLMWQAGARPFHYTDGGVSVDLVGNDSNKVAAYWQRMIDEGLVNTNVSPFTPAEFKAWTDGSLASVIGAAWFPLLMEPNAPKASGKWAVAPLPQWDPVHPTGANYGGSAHAVFSGADHPAEAAEFAAWLTRNAKAFNLLATSTPAAIAGQSSAKVDQPVEYFQNQPIYSIFRDAGGDVDTSFEWAPNMTFVYSSMSDGLTAVIQGQSTIPQALRQAQGKVVDNLDSQGIEVVGER